LPPPLISSPGKCTTQHPDDELRFLLLE
jgi:hypothetical protein